MGTVSPSLAAPPDRAAQIWLGGEDPVVQRDKHKQDPADYMNLFKPNAPWATAAAGLTAFKISTQFVLHADDEQLRAVIDGLKSRHIGLAIELGVLDGEGPGHCGFHVEGYASPASINAVGRKVQKLGGQIDYVAMDEPVWFGHIFGNGAGDKVGCRYSLAGVADKVATKIAQLRQFFPKIQIGDVEPVNGRSGGPQSIADTIAFVDLLRQKTGGAPAFLHADIAWNTNWSPLLESLATQLHARGIRLGIICDGDANVGGDAAWVAQALQRCRAIAANGKVKPDDYIVQSWEPLPTRMLPETDAGTLTYEAKQARALFH
jgi:hypothetical protein